jgi:hypothetical protein
VVGKVCAMLRSRGQEAVVSGPLPAAGAEDDDVQTARGRLVGALTACRLPVSWLPSGDAPGAGGGRRRALASAARDNVQTLVRACWPGTLAPELDSTRLGFAFVQARDTSVGVVVDSDTASASLLARLRLWGFAATRLQSGDAAPTAGSGRSITFLPGFREAALSLAGDLGVPRRSVVRSDDSAREVVVTVAP